MYRIVPSKRSWALVAQAPKIEGRKNLAWWAVTRRTSKNCKTVKIGGWALTRDNTVYDNNICTVYFGQNGLQYQALSAAGHLDAVVISSTL